MNLILFFSLTMYTILYQTQDLVLKVFIGKISPVSFNQFTIYKPIHIFYNGIISQDNNQ